MPRTTISVAVAAALALVLLAGCASGAPAEPSPEPATTPAASEPQPDPSPSAEPEGIDTTDWLTYSTHDGDMTYRHPADWTLGSESVESEPDVDGSRWYDSATLTAPTGQQLLQSGDYVDVGGACGEDYQFPVEVLASEPASAGEDTSLLTIALGTDDGRWAFGVGIASSDMVPEPGTKGCAVYFIFGSSDGGVSVGTHFMLASIADDPLWTVDSLDDARAYMETDEYATIVEILRSVRTS